MTHGSSCSTAGESLFIWTRDEAAFDGSSILDVYNTSFFSNIVRTGYRILLYELRYREPRSVHLRRLNTVYSQE
jgi:hypothetical protein